MSYAEWRRRRPPEPFRMANKQVDCFNPGQQSTIYTNAPLGLIYPGDKGCNNTATTVKYGSVQPRIGVAFRLDQRGDTAIRAGYGLYSAQAQLQSFIGFSAPPFNRSFQIANAFQKDSDPFGSNGL